MRMMFFIAWHDGSGATFPAEYSHLNSLTNQISDCPIRHVSSNDRMRPTTPPPPISFEQGTRLAELSDAHTTKKR